MKAVIEYFVVARAGRNKGIVAAYGRWPWSTIKHRGLGDSVARRMMTPDEKLEEEKRTRHYCVTYSHLESLLEDERRCLIPDHPEIYRKGERRARQRRSESEINSMSKKKASTARRGARSAPPSGSASINGLFVGEWCAETIWQRAERARVFLHIMGYSTADEADEIAKRIRRDKTPEGMRLNHIETLDGKPGSGLL